MLLLVLFSFAAQGDELADFAGSWEGLLHYADEPLDVRMTIDPGADPVVTVDYPQFVFNNQPAGAEVEGDALKVEMPLGLGTYELRLNDGKLGATRTTSSGAEISIALHPVPPFRVVTREIELGAFSPSIGGTLTLPPGKGPFPVAILLAGSNNPTRDNLSYTSWSDRLARIGIASLAYDRRADDELTAHGTLFTIPDHAAEVLAAVDQLVLDDRIDSQRIGVIAKSRGGWIALEAAARDPRIAFIVGIGTAAVDVAQQDLQALEARMRAGEEPEEDIQAALAYMRIYFHTAKHPADWPRLEAASREAADTGWGERVRIPEVVEDLAWFRAQLDFHPLELISQIDAPMFLAWGSEDRTTPASMNRPLFEWLMSEASAGASVLRVYPDASHTLEGPLNVDDDPETVWTGINPDFLREVDAWLRAHVSDPE